MATQKQTIKIFSHLIDLAHKYKEKNSKLKNELKMYQEYYKFQCEIKGLENDKICELEDKYFNICCEYEKYPVLDDRVEQKYDYVKLCFVKRNILRNMTHDISDENVINEYIQYTDTNVKKNYEKCGVFGIYYMSPLDDIVMIGY